MPFDFGRFSLDDVLWVISSRAPGPGVVRRIKNLENILSLLKKQKIEGVFGKGLLISVEAELLFTGLLFLQEESRWWNPMKSQIPFVIKEEMIQRFGRIKEDIKRLKRVALAYYTDFVGDKKSFNTWWSGIFGLDVYLTEKSIKNLA